MEKLASRRKDEAPPNISLRSPDVVMRLSRMGAFHQSRLSFLRVLLRKLKKENWHFDRPLWRIDSEGVGVATYCARGPDSIYSLIIYSHNLKDEQRSDRVIAKAWDATFVLFDGEATEEEIVRLNSNVPLQEAGRISETELILGRANKSLRLFSYVRKCLASGSQPKKSVIDEIGYLMRTTAVYGAGKFGAADMNCWKKRSEFSGSFQPEMLAIWLTRMFSVDLVEHMAQIDSPMSYVRLDPQIRRQLGIGNATGLGMAPFLINHPTLIHSWINARETALARVRSLDSADTALLRDFQTLIRRAKLNQENWKVDDPKQFNKVKRLGNDLDALLKKTLELTDATRYPWNVLFVWSMEHMSIEGQEALISLMMEPFGYLIDDLSSTMSADETKLNRINGKQTTFELTKIVHETYDWAARIDFNTNSERGRIWYISDEKLEPRLGERFSEELDRFEQPLSPGYDAMRLMKDLEHSKKCSNVAEFLLLFPEHRHIIRRVQTVSKMKYAEIRDNTISADMIPVDLLRFKLSFFGATNFDPRSDRWLRINLFQHMPFPDEMSDLDPDDMVFPQLIDQEYC